MTPPSAPPAPTTLSGGLSQHARLITLTTAQDAHLPEALVVERFTGQEAVNADFHFDIEALSGSTDVDLKQFIGEEMTLRLLQADGTYRAWHGYCTAAAWLGSDGGVARYRLRLESFLAFLDKRRDCFLFQDMTSTEIAAAILADYGQANFRLDITQTLAKRPICTQYRESDLAFLMRVLAADGLNIRFIHDQDAPQVAHHDQAAGTSGTHARHQLVIFDSAGAHPPMPGGTDTIRFHRTGATEAVDAMTDFSAARRVQPNAVVQSSWHPAQLIAPAATDISSLQAGELPPLEVFDGSSERGFANRDAAAFHSKLVLQALELDNKGFDGAGAVRQLTAGHSFTLTQHDRYADGANRFTVLAVTHMGINNIDTGLAPTASMRDPASGLNGTYRNCFTCVRASVPIVPRAIAQRIAPQAPGPQIALVVGLPDAVLTSERNHCVKIQFVWQRGVQPVAGGLTATGNSVDTTGNAPGNETSGTWVRVAEALAGPNWGTQFTPRIGSEVLVDFIEGEIDRPVIVAQLYNGSDLPPYSAGVDAGTDHIGTLSGWHSRALDGEGYNQWVVDDTTGQLRMRLASSTAATQLNLGYLVTQSASSAARGAYRGNGFELRTDAWGVLRGAEGVLISTTARTQSGASVTGTQMDATEAVAQLKGAAQLAKALGMAATQQQALHSTDADAAQTHLVATIDVQDLGKHPASVNGQDAHKAAAGSRAADASQPVERFASPVVVIDAPSSVSWASPASTVVFAGQHLQWTSQSDLHLAAGDSLSAVSGAATTLFTHDGGLQAIAANGPVSLQSHTDALEIIADKAVTVISVNDTIEIMAQQKIVLQAGQSSVTLEGGNITFACPGTFSVKGGLHPFGSGARGSAELGKLPDSRVHTFDESFVVRDPNGKALPFIPYTIDGPGGKLTAHSEIDGLTTRVWTEAADKLKFALRWHDLEKS